MLRLTFIFCYLIMLQLLIAQHGKLTINLDQQQAISLCSMSHQDTLDILIDNDTTLVTTHWKNNMFYIQNANLKYYLYLSENELDSTVVHVKDSVYVSGDNSHFIVFLNEYVNLYHSKFESQFLISNYNSIDELEIDLYNLINNDIYSFYNTHRYFSFFSPSNRDYFSALLKYEYLSTVSGVLFNLQKDELNFNKDNDQLVLKLIELNWLDWTVLINDLNDSAYYGLSLFQDYTFEGLFLFALNNYNTGIATINDFQNFALYFLNFIYKHAPNELRFIYLQKMIQTCSGLLKQNTFDYIIQFLINSDFSVKNRDVLITLFEHNYNQLLDKDFTVRSESIISHDFYMEDIFGKACSLDDFIGDVLYIDIWASWCGPCRKQFPYSKELKRKFSKRQQKKIKFIYISIDNDYEKWKKSLGKLNIDGEHFISPANHSNSAANYFQASSIPRYILIDKNGKIVNMHAKRPSDEGLFDELLNLLE